jgi:hypothetical protein
MTKIASIARRFILPSTNRTETLYTDADVKDIITAILRADTMSANFTARFAPYLKGSTDQDTLRNVWQFVRKYIRYQKDRSGNEIIKSPGRTWADKYGDCKSMSVMVASLVKNLGYEYFYRVAFYDPNNPEQGHIYPVAVLPGGELVVVDAVHHTYNEEVTYWKAYDYNPETGTKSKAVAITGTQPAAPGWPLLAMLAAGAAFAYFNRETPTE